MNYADSPYDKINNCNKTTKPDRSSPPPICYMLTYKQCKNTIYIFTFDILTMICLLYACYIAIQYSFMNFLCLKSFEIIHLDLPYLALGIVL